MSLILKLIVISFLLGIATLPAAVAGIRMGKLTAFGGDWCTPKVDVTTHIFQLGHYVILPVTVSERANWRNICGHSVRITPRDTPNFHLTATVINLCIAPCEVLGTVAVLALIQEGSEVTIAR